MKIFGESPFSVPTDSFAISPSNSEYTLNYSVDGIHFTPWTASTPSNETLVVNGFAKHMCFKLVNNTDEVYLQY